MSKRNKKIKWEEMLNRMFGTSNSRDRKLRDLRDRNGSRRQSKGER